METRLLFFYLGSKTFYLCGEQCKSNLVDVVNRQLDYEFFNSKESNEILLQLASSVTVVSNTDEVDEKMWILRHLRAFQ